MRRFSLSPRKDVAVKAGYGDAAVTLKNSLVSIPSLFWVSFPDKHHWELLQWWSSGIEENQAGLPWWLSSKESTCNARAAGNSGSIPGLGRSPGREHGSALQYSCLQNPKDRAAQQATVRRVAVSQTRRKWLSTHACRCRTWAEVAHVGFSPPHPGLLARWSLNARREGLGMLCCPLPLLLRVPSSAAPESVVYGRTQLNHIFLCINTYFLFLMISF